MNNTKLQQLLLDKGYYYHKSGMNKILKSTEHLYQRCIRDDKGKRYYIDIWYYPVERSDGKKLSEGIQVEAHLYDSEGKFLIMVRPNIDCQWITETEDRLYSEESIDKAEGMIHTAWETFGKGYYEINNED